MNSEVSANNIRRAEFRTAIRGLDRVEVEAYLDVVAGRFEQLEGEIAKLQTRLEETQSTDLESEFESVGRDVSAILQSAREAAESLRERASMDAARWRSEAMEETDVLRREAAADAEALRRDAWVSGSELLEQSQEEADSMLANAERDVLTTMGEAEREAHRLTSSARREAEDLLRQANMDAESITNDAKSRRDQIIDNANQQASAAQERTRALEQRRDELLDELENVRSTLTRLEGSLEERREVMDLSTETTSVKVVHPPEDAKKEWELGETVRVVPTDHGAPPPPDPEFAEEMSREAEPEPEPEPEAEIVDDPAPDPEPEEDPAPEATTSDDDVGALFASLRSADEPTQTDEEPPASESIDSQADEPSAEESGETVDWLDERESVLLPITNRALRGVKKAMTEVQNVTLDSLRTDENWTLAASVISDAVHAELVAVWSESFSAGHTVAEQMSGEKLKRPQTPKAKGEADFASDLANAVTDAVESAGDGPRERQAAASKVFRVWRSDEAERRIRDVALEAYETGLEKSRSVGV